MLTQQRQTPFPTNHLIVHPLSLRGTLFSALHCCWSVPDLRRMSAFLALMPGMASVTRRSLHVRVGKSPLSNLSHTIEGLVKGVMPRRDLSIILRRLLLIVLLYHLPVMWYFTRVVSEFMVKVGIKTMLRGFHFGKALKGFRYCMYNPSLL